MASVYNHRRIINNIICSREAPAIINMKTTKESAVKGKLPTAWKDSEAKQRLREDILQGMVTEEMDARQVFEMREEYQDYNFNNFKTNLKNLRTSILCLQESAQIAHVAHQNYTKLLTNNTNCVANSRRYPKWNDSEAAHFLALDVDARLYETLKPEALWMSRLEYQNYPLKVFRDHLHGEQRKRKERAYWGNLRRRKKGT
jgi:hypothetical protein